MHAIFFSLKRAFHGSLRVGRDALGRGALTPARFDMMYAIGQGLTQRALRDQLGVSAPTVSRMLRSLEELGLVVRRPWEDARQRWVRLTKLGWRVFRAARREVMDSGFVTLALDSALVGSLFHDFSACFLAKSEFEDTLGRIRGAFRDHAVLSYPWHPDD